MKPSRRKSRWIWFIIPALSGCGTHVPEIQEFWGGPDDTQIRVNAIAGQVNCELREGMRWLLANDDGHKLDFLKGWGAQAQLILTVQEKTALSPGLTFTSPFVTPSQTVSGGFGATFSADATRIDKVTFFYKLDQYVGKPPAMMRDDPTKPISCVPGAKDRGSFFLYSDLKLRQWLSDALVVRFTGTSDVANGGSEKQVISHEVKFVVISDGNVTPSWKLVRLSANTGNAPFFDARRDRTQDLIITLGPVQTTNGVTSLAPAAQSSAAASEFGASVAAQLRGVQLPGI